MSRDLLIASQEFLSQVYLSTSRWGYIDAHRWNAFFYWMRDNEFIPGDSTNTAFVNVSY